MITKHKFEGSMCLDLNNHFVEAGDKTAHCFNLISLFKYLTVIEIGIKGLIQKEKLHKNFWRITVI